MTVRAAARRRAALESRGWAGVELVAADALDPASLDRALAGIDIAYYLVHSMAAGADFPRIDREAAVHFRDAAARAGVKRIVYLGGLQPAQRASAHLASRGETGDLLREGAVPVTELRAGMIIGPGSAAFEVIRDLVFHLPGMVTPRWVRSRSQPIALADVLEYLARLPLLPDAAGRIYDAGGPEVLTYEELMRQFGALVGRHPVIVPVPVLTPQLSSYWLGLVTVGADERRAGADRRPGARRARGRRAHQGADSAGAHDLSRGGRGGARGQASRERDGALDGRVDALPPEPAGLRVLREAPAGRGGRRGAGGRRLARSRRDRRRTRLLLSRRGVEGARLRRPDRRRHRLAPRPARSATTSSSATRWTSGASSRSSRAGGSRCSRKCGCRVRPRSTSS